MKCFLVGKFNFHADLRSSSGRFSSGQDIELEWGWSCYMPLDLAACEHIGALPDSLVHFDLELLIKNSDTVK